MKGHWALTVVGVVLAAVVFQGALSAQADGDFSALVPTYVGDSDGSTASTGDALRGRPAVGSVISTIPTFADVPTSAMFYADIQWMYDQGISAGYVDEGGIRTYHPADPVSRSAMAAFLYRAAGSPAFVPPTAPSFSDVPTTGQFYKEIEWLKAHGVTTGNAGGTYAPGNPVSRQAMAAFLYRSAGSPVFTPPLTASFSDVAVGSTFFTQVEWMKAQGITAGNANGTYAPAGAVSRQAMAAFLHRAADPQVFSAPPTPVIGGSPAYGSVLQANPGNWGVNGVSFQYQWLSNGATIGGATGPTYTVASINIGQTVGLIVTGSAPGYISTAVSSAPTPMIPTPLVTGNVATRTQRMSQSNLNSSQTGWYESGTVLTLVCYQRGQSVRGYFSSSFATGWDNLWYRISDGSYAADVDIETGTLDPVVPVCADQPVADTTNAAVMATTQRMSSDTLSSTQSGVYSGGARLTLSCYLHGQAVKGYFSSSFPGGYDDLWYQVDDGYWVADVDIQTGSNNPVTPACVAPPAPPAVSSDEITRAQSWIDAKVPYNQGGHYSNIYGNYREDCSGFVSMALGLPSSYTTVTLPQVMHPITQGELQPGDFMLNTASGDNGHVAIFMGWTDASHAHYTSWEENPGLGGASMQNVPYPYWPTWSGSSHYTPYRRN